MWKKKMLPTKAEDAVNACLAQGLVNATSVRLLLRSFITGDQKDVMEPLHVVMDVAKVADQQGNPQNLLSWVPFFMNEVLTQFRLRSYDDRSPIVHSSGELIELPCSVRLALKEFPYLLNRFVAAKEGSGDPWETLFASVALIRSASAHMDCQLFPFGSRFHDRRFSVDYDRLAADKGFPETPEDFVKALVPPDTYPHVDVHYMVQAAFQAYDVIVVAWEKQLKKPAIYGYQFRLPLKPLGNTCENFTESFCLQRYPPKKPGKKHGWTIASHEQITEFLGVSGRGWTPSQWVDLDDVPPGRWVK